MLNRTLFMLPSRTRWYLRLFFSFIRRELSVKRMNEFVINIYLFFSFSCSAFVWWITFEEKMVVINMFSTKLAINMIDVVDEVFFFWKFWEKYFDYSPPTITIRWFDSLRSFQLRREYVADNAINWISIDSSSVILIKRKVSLLMNWKKIIKIISKWITRFHQTNLFILLTI